MRLWVTTTLVALLLAIGGDLVKAKKTLEETAKELEAGPAPTQCEVKPVGRGKAQKKHLVLTYSNEGGKKKKSVELLPFDPSAYGLTNENFVYSLQTGFKKDENSGHYNLVVSIRYNNDLGMWFPLNKEPYKHTIYRTGNISFVRVFGAWKKGPWEEEKLYYVRVPIGLFLQLGGEALQKQVGSPFRDYTPTTCHNPPDYLPSTAFPCLAINFGSSEQTQVVAAPLYPIGNEHYITASTVREYERLNYTHQPTKFEVQYVITGSLESLQLDDQKPQASLPPPNQSDGEGP